jgi:hypothetical protein
MGPIGSTARGGNTVNHEPMTRIAEVAVCTKAAVHRRDHHHGHNADDCHPHVVEVVHLGGNAVTVCHDCQADSGFLPRREAEALATAHRELTRDVSVKLRSS